MSDSDGMLILFTAVTAIAVKDLRPQFEEHLNKRESLIKLLTNIPTTSDFYENARQHMNQNLNTDIDELLVQLQQYNKDVELLNPQITEIINEILSAPMPGPLNEQHQESIYEIVRACFRDVILTVDTDITNAFRRHEMTSKVRVNTHGAYEFDGEENRAINILKNIENNVQIKQDLDNLRNQIHNIINKMNEIRNQISETVEQIEQGNYRRRIWRCCPSLIRELLHYV